MSPRLASRSNASHFRRTGTRSGKADVSTRTGRGLGPTGPVIGVAELTASDAQRYNRFGNAVAVSADGSTIVVGSYGNHEDSGAAYVFTAQGATWDQTAELEPPTHIPISEFGAAVATSPNGRRLVVAEPRYDEGVSGSVNIYTHNATGWGRPVQINPSDGTSYDEFGASLDISADGTTLVVGAFDATYIVTHSATGWTQTAKLDPTDGGPDDYFGASVAASPDGSIVFVGALGHAPGGAVYEFTSTGGTWTQTAELASPGNGQFGRSIALSGSASTLVVGAWRDHAKGAAYVYTNAGGPWTEQVKLVASDPAAQNHFGEAVAMDSAGRWALIGSPGNDNDTGAAYLFRT